eukprot:9421157-Ditylum_brightwellii.AAC.1
MKVTENFGGINGTDTVLKVKTRGCKMEAHRLNGCVGDNICNVLRTAVQHSAATHGGQSRTFTAIFHQDMLLQRSCKKQMQQTGRNSIISGDGSLRPPRSMLWTQSGRSEENFNPHLDHIFINMIGGILLGRSRFGGLRHWSR